MSDNDIIYVAGTGANLLEVRGPDTGGVVWFATYDLGRLHYARLTLIEARALADALIVKLDLLELEALPKMKKEADHFPVPEQWGGAWFEATDAPPMPPWLTEDKDD